MSVAADIKERGMDAVREWALKLDGVEPELAEPNEGMLPRTELLDLADRVRRWHSRQRPQDITYEVEPGVVLERRWVALDTVGVYVPTKLISTLVMCCVPAQVAGVENIVVCTPPSGAGLVAAAAEALGIDEVWALGGPQAIGFLLVATFLGALEMMLDRGLEDDWFGSSFIIAVAAVCALAFVSMIPWEIRHRFPAVDVRMLATRQFGASFLVMLSTGAILLATTQFLPQLVQQDFGYTATWAGLVLSPGGIVTMLMMFVVGRLSTDVQPKYLIVAGAILTALSMYELTSTYGDVGFWFFARTRMVLGVGLPLIFLPIMAASYDGVPPEKTDQASALMNAARNTGGSIGISIVSNVLAHREQFHQSRAFVLELMVVIILIIDLVYLFRGYKPI
jgi:hypothetical protein